MLCFGVMRTTWVHISIPLQEEEILSIDSLVFVSRLSGHRGLIFMCTEVLPRGLDGRGVKMTYHLHLKPWLWMSGAIYRYVSAYAFMERTGTFFTFLSHFADECTNIRWEKMRFLIRSHFEFMSCLTLSLCIFCLSSNSKIYHKKIILETSFS